MRRVVRMRSSASLVPWWPISPLRDLSDARGLNLLSLFKLALFSDLSRLYPLDTFSTLHYSGPLGVCSWIAIMTAARRETGSSCQRAPESNIAKWSTAAPPLVLVWGRLGGMIMRRAGWCGAVWWHGLVRRCGAARRGGAVRCHAVRCRPISTPTTMQRNAPKRRRP